MQALTAMEAQVAGSPEGQVSLTDPDARSMAASGRGSGMLGYNVQSVMEAEHHLIVAHDVVTAIGVKALDPGGSPLPIRSASLGITPRRASRSRTA